MPSGKPVTLLYKGVLLLDFHPQDVIISLINIVVLFVLLRLILWKHVIRFLSERAGHVRSEMDDAEKHRLDAEALGAKYKEKLEGIEERGRDMMRESKLKADEESARILKETHDRARVMIQDAETRIAEEKEQALGEAALDITGLATDMASRILKREVSPEDNKDIIDEFFRKG